MYNIVICDDDSNYIQHLKDLLIQSGFHPQETTFYEFTSGEAFIDNFSVISTIDLLILDIQMPGMDGDSVAGRFRDEYPTGILVFCSGVCLPTVKSFITNPYRYLLKDYTTEQMLSELSAIANKVKSEHTVPIINAKYYKRIVRLVPNDILYAAIGRNCSIIHVNPQMRAYEYDNKLTVNMKLPNLYELLKDYNFEYAHNSYIVNLKYIKRITATTLILTTGRELNISRSKDDSFREAYAKYISKKY